MIQIFEDEFNFPNMDQVAPEEAGKAFIKAGPKYCAGEKETTYFRKHVGGLLHMMRQSRSDIYNSIRDLSSHMNVVPKDRIKQMHCIMTYVVSTPTLGCKLKPEIKWEGKNCDF